MSTSFDQLRVRLIQIRERPDILEEEQQSFVARARLDRRQLVTTNALREDLSERILEDVDAVFIGGAGAYSVTRTYPWTQDLVHVCVRCAERRLPLFGSCWGHQFIARAFGGRVIRDEERSEMGTREVDLTQAGKADPIFRTFPDRFWAQMGHQDRVAELPAGAVELATNDVAPFQAFRLADVPIYGTQFHSELDEAAERARLFAYRDHYPEMQLDDNFQQTLDSLRATPAVDDLLFIFLKAFAVDGPGHAA